MMHQKWREHLLPPPLRSVVSPADVSYAAAIEKRLHVMPGTQGEIDELAAVVLRLDRFIDRARSVDIFLVPQRAHHHHWHAQRPARENLVHRLRLPEVIVCRMLDDVLPKLNLIGAVEARQLSHGS